MVKQSHCHCLGVLSLPHCLSLENSMKGYHLAKWICTAILLIVLDLCKRSPAQATSTTTHKQYISTIEMSILVIGYFSFSKSADLR